MMLHVMGAVVAGSSWLSTVRSKNRRCARPDALARARRCAASAAAAAPAVLLPPQRRFFAAVCPHHPLPQYADSLRLRRAWWSDRGARVPLTVVTGLTATRLDQLAAQCASWSGPLSAAVYIAVRGDGKGGVGAEGEEALAKAEAEVADFHKKAEAAGGGCQLDASLLYEIVGDDTMAVLLPINVMRNYALLQARTRLVAMVDVDLLVSRSLGEWMESKDK